jgi:hypothetical protein
LYYDVNYRWTKVMRQRRKITVCLNGILARITPAKRVGFSGA